MRLLQPFRPILTDPALALTAALLVLFGAHVATLLPQISTIAVSIFGLSDGAYSLILVMASLISVSSSVGFGILADQRANRRAIALVSAAFLAAGSGLMTLLPSGPAFMLAHGLLLPMANSLFGQLFALGRLAGSLRPPEERAGLQSTLRALFALPWLLVLPLWSLAFRQGVSLSAVYPVCLGLALVVLVLTWLFWPRDGATRWPDPKSGLKFRQALREMADWRVLSRVLALGTVNGGVTLYLILIGLVFAQIPGRGASDVAIYAGVVAGLEVPFMLALPLLLGRVAQVRLIWWGTALYAVHLAFLPLLAPGAAVWLLPLFAAIGGAVILTLPMAYLQELLAARPGAGASLLALQKLIGDTISASVFAICAALSGYQLAAATGAVLAVLAASLLAVMDRRRDGF